MFLRNCQVSVPCVQEFFIFPFQLQVQIARLNSLELEKAASKDRDNVERDRILETLEIANSVVQEIKLDEILANSVVKHDNRPDAAEIKKDLEKQKIW